MQPCAAGWLALPPQSLQSDFASGIGWGVFGVLGASPGVTQIQLALPEAPAFSVKLQEEKGVLHAQT